MKKLNRINMQLPKMPLTKITNETRQVGVCDKCGSSLIRKYWVYLWGKTKCINIECDNNKQN